VPDNYTLTFTSPTTYQITDSATPTPNVVSTGNYTTGSAISFNGVQVSMTGTPATNDSFSINQSRKEDIFSTLNTIVRTLSQPGSTDAINAKISTVLGGSLQQIDQAIDHLSVVRADVGARLNTLDTTESQRLDSNNNIAKSLSDLRDVDYATALTKYSQQQVVLQAAQQSYAKIAQLSLFNYL
jgi:flagellar hook-associated protein 3 FlgL